MTRTFLLALVALALCGNTAHASGRPPNIIHIVADDVGYDDIGCFGARLIATPNIDRLAKQGMRFTSFYAPHHLCTPTRAALLTGCYAQRVGLPVVLFPNNTYGLSSSEVTIAELLRARGYRTALIGKWHLGHLPPFLPTRHGFDLFFGIPYPNDHVPERLTQTEPKKSRGFPPMPLYRGEKIVEQPAQLATLPQRFTAEAVQFIADNKGRPFYLHLANIETHIPWLVTRPFMYKSKAGLFGDAVQCLDWTVGQVMQAVNKHGLEKDTLIVFSSDNGALTTPSAELEGIFGHAAAVDTTRERLLRGGKGQARFEGGVRVACVMSWPGKIAAGSECAEAAAGFDLYTTFAKLAGAEPPRDRIIDGKDIAPLMFGQKGARSPHEAIYHYENLNLVAVRAGKWKLVLPGGGGKKKPAVPKAMLFDLEADLRETRDLAAQHPEVIERLMVFVERAREDLGDALTKRPGKNRRPPGEAK
jgi:arylsulfatase A-like enzyme